MIGALDVLVVLGALDVGVLGVDVLGTLGVDVLDVLGVDVLGALGVDVVGALGVDVLGMLGVLCAPFYVLGGVGEVTGSLISSWTVIASET